MNPFQEARETLKTKEEYERFASWITNYLEIAFYTSQLETLEKKYADFAFKHALHYAKTGELPSIKKEVL